MTSCNKQPLDKESEINAAIEVVRDYFEANYQGCTLLDVWYDEESEIVKKIEKSSMEQYDAEKSIVLYSDFKVSESGAEAVLLPGSTYKDYMWILVKNGTEDWTLKGWGY